MVWSDYRKAYDLVPHSWVNECMEMFGIAENLRTFLQKSMQQWRLSLTANGEDLGEVNVKRGIFQGASIAIVVCVEYGAIIFDSLEGKYMLKMGKEGI